MKKFFILIVFLNFSCSSIQEILYGANKNLQFDSKKDAVAYVNKKNKLDKDKVFFFNNEKDRMSFIKKRGS